MAIVQFRITTPRAGFTGEGAAQIYFRNSEATIDVDLNDWSAGNARGPLSYFRSQGFGIEPLSGVSVEQALADPAAEATALLNEKAELQRQLDAETAREDVEGLRKQVEDMRARRAEQDRAAGTNDTLDANQAPAGEEGVKTAENVRTDVVPPSPDAAVADWRAYAVEIDPQLDDKAAKSLGKPELVERYGSAYAPQEGTVQA